MNISSSSSSSFSSSSSLFCSFVRSVPLAIQEGTVAVWEREREEREREKEEDCVRTHVRAAPISRRWKAGQLSSAI